MSTEGTPATEPSASTAMSLGAGTVAGSRRQDGGLVAREVRLDGSQWRGRSGAGRGARGHRDVDGDGVNRGRIASA
jgi:hypothetical protein